MNEFYYTYYESPIGMIKIAGNDHVITEVNFVDNSEEIIYGEPGISDVIHQCTEELIEFFNGRRKIFTVPVHQEGTTFQQKVWSELLHIPFGKTISYLELSKLIGDVNAVRAVAASNGKNKIMILLPCHRVIGSNKSLTGYAGGLHRKKWLLQHEFRIVHGVQMLF